MKDLIIDIRPWNKELFTAALEAGVTTFILDKGKTEIARKLGKCLIIAEDGDKILGRDVTITTITNAHDEERIIKLNGDIIIKTPSWKIIPLENLVSKSDSIYAYGTASDIPMLLGVLEVGVKGVVIRPDNPTEIQEAVAHMTSPIAALTLVPAEITHVSITGNGERSCIDTCTRLPPGRGMLVGNSSNFLFLVHSESIESEYCQTRPFRVNAGAIHSYILLSDDKTKYLSELVPGDRVITTDANGNAKESIVGRNKIEERPLIIVTATAEGKSGSIILQNAETIRLVRPQGHVSVSELRLGDKVLVRLDDVGRHFGTAITEKISE